MNKWCGKIGYAENIESEPGIWESTIIEREYYGDIISNHFKHQSSGNINDNINISNSISVIADPYAIGHCSKMIYIEFMDAKWKITDIEVKFPRLILTIGGVYNG